MTSIQLSHLCRIGQKEKERQGKSGDGWERKHNPFFGQKEKLIGFWQRCDCHRFSCLVLRKLFLWQIEQMLHYLSLSAGRGAQVWMTDYFITLQDRWGVGGAGRSSLCYWIKGRTPLRWFRGISYLIRAPQVPWALLLSLPHCLLQPNSPEQRGEVDRGDLGTRSAAQKDQILIIKIARFWM